MRSLPGVPNLGFLLWQELSGLKMLNFSTSTPCLYSSYANTAHPSAPGKPWYSRGPGSEDPELGSELVPAPHQWRDPDKQVLSGPPQCPHVHRAGTCSIYFTGRQSSHLRTPVVPEIRGPGSGGLGCRCDDGAMMWVLFGSQNMVPTGWVCCFTQRLSMPLSRKGGNELKFQHHPLGRRTCRRLPECVHSGPSASSWAMC